jgi:AMP phosphorylase
LKKKIVADKHSSGGVPGDKTTLLLVPIIASAGITIPKTSSRAISSAAGSADRAECLMPVALTIEEMRKVVEKANGCIVWGGKLDLAPADDIFIKIEYPLGIDPLLLPSIMSKKKAVGATHLVIDIPCGRGTKIKTIGDADLLAKDFIELGKRLGIKTRCAITYGEQPVGYSIGPALEAREALEVLMNKKIVPDLIDKVVDLSGIIFEMVGKRNGREIALKILKSGKAEKKLREIIALQGGNEKIKPNDIKVGEFSFDVISDSNGILLWLSNSGLVEVARAAGSPKDKGAGILLNKKIGEKVRKGEKVFTIFAEKERKLDRAIKLLEEEKVFAVGERMEMLIHEIKELPLHKKVFILER